MPNQNNLGMPVPLQTKVVKSPRINQNPLDSNGFEDSAVESPEEAEEQELSNNSSVIGQLEIENFEAINTEQ